MVCFRRIKEKPTLKQLNDPLTRMEFNQAIKKIILHKAPGLNGVSPNAIKALDDENRNVLFEICYDFFDGNVEIEEWQIGNLKILPKKGDTSNPNNWRGINLLDVVSKLMSIILNTRLQIALEKYGTPLQFGASPKLGCAEGSFSLRSLLQMRKEHNLQSWVVFADLIKAFDSIDHKLLFALLEKFGIPDRPLQAIKKLYKNFKIELKIGKCKSQFEYSAGVKQGDNLAPTLFIIVMHFLAEILEKKWNENNILIPSFFHNSNLPNKGGKLIRHDTSYNKKGGLASYKSQRPFTKDELFYFFMSTMEL